MGLRRKKKLKSKLIEVNKFGFNNFLKNINNKYFLSNGNIENLLFNDCNIIRINKFMFLIKSK